MLSLLMVVGTILSLGESKSWHFVDGTESTTLVGIGGESEVRAVAGASSSGGAVIKRYNGEYWTQEQSDGAGLLLDAAVGSTVTVATSIFPIIVSDNGGLSYETVDNLGGASQSAHVSASGVISLVGSFLIPAPNEYQYQYEKPIHAYGVARSVDSGKSWNVSNVPDGYCRYGAFPSEVC